MDPSSTSSPVAPGADHSAELPVHALLDGFDASAGSNFWAMLGQVWSAMGADLWGLIPEGRDVFAAIPDSAAEHSISLREMRASARNEPGAAGSAVSQDAALMVSLTEERTYDPGSDEIPEAPSGGPSPDEIATNVVHAVRRAREFGAYQEARSIAERGLDRLKDLEGCGKTPTPRNYVRVLMEGGRTEFSIGDFPRAAALIREASRAAGEQLPRESSLRIACIAWDQYIRLGAGLGAAGSGSSSAARGTSNENVAWARGLPPTVTAGAIGALNRLDLECTSFDALDDLVASAPGDIATAAAVVSLQRDLMRGDRARAALTLDRCISMHGAGLREATAMGRAIGSAHLSILLHSGHAYRAHSLLKEMRAWGARVNAADNIRFTLATGDHDRVVNLANSALADPHLNVGDKGCVYALKSSSLLALGQPGEAHREFRTALRAAGMAGSLLTIAHLPAVLRDELIIETVDAPEWEGIEIGLGIRKAEAVRRLTSCFAHGDDLKLPRLTAKDVHLLACIDSAQSVAEVACEMNIAAGTVRNNLSALYRKLDVAGWKDAVAHAYRHGILPPAPHQAPRGDGSLSSPPSPLA